MWDAAWSAVSAAATRVSLLPSRLSTSRPFPLQEKACLPTIPPARRPRTDGGLRPAGTNRGKRIMNLEQVPAPEAPKGGEGVRRWLVALVSVVCRFPLPVLILSLSLCGLSIYAAATRLEYYTQRNDLVSPRKEYQQRWQKYLAEFGEDDDIVVVVRGEDRARMQDAIEAIAARVNEK